MSIIPVYGQDIPCIPGEGYPDPPFLQYEHSVWVDSLMGKLSLEEKIAQLFMIRAYSNRGKEHTEYLEQMVRRHKVGGVLFFQGGPARQLALTRHLQELAGVPLLVALDGEWGPGMRLDSTLTYPRQMMLGAVPDDSLIYRMGQHIASQFGRLGIHMNFAPVVDINNNPLNPVINSRSFGEDRWNVAVKGLAYALGLQSGHVLPTAKHFPGHGDTGTDSHHALPLIPFSRARLDSLELFPYRYMIPRGLGGVMVAHLEVPALDPKPGQVSTLSERIVSGVLQEEMGFRGLVVTDALDMKGVSGALPPGDLELAAFQAGNDILLLSENIPRAIHTIRRAVRRGQIAKEEIDRRCRKILAAKQWAMVNRLPEPESGSLYEDLHRPEYLALQRDLVASAITLLTNRDSLLPLRDIHTLRIATVSIGGNGHTSFQEQVDLYIRAGHYSLPKEASRTDMLQLLGRLKGYDLVLAGIHGTHEIPSRRFGITDQTIAFIDTLVVSVPTVVDVFANPYSLAYFSRLDRAHAVIMSYEDTPLAQEYSAQLIFGGISARGRLPVTASPGFRAGQGVFTAKTRLGFGIPEQEGMNSEVLMGIDSVVQLAIREKATPGCQVLVARNGRVVYHKAFGYHTYQKRQPVLTSHLYDLASITKIAATLPALMRLYEQGMISLDERVGKYLPALDTTDKGELKLIDILTHQSRLNGWVPFYRHTLEPLDTSQDLYAREISDRYPYRVDTRLYLNRDYQFRPGIYQSQFSMNYPVQVAENLFINRHYADSIDAMIAASALREKKEYHYSDLGFYWFRKIIENLTGESLENYVAANFHQPLGAFDMVYRPLVWFPREWIVPTENDPIFRKQLLRGHVHDPGAAMLGGVAGHAGLFANALDLARLMQMYLNGGEYGGHRFFQPSTLELFTSSPFREEGNRRGIGFDKPETDPEKEGPACLPASPESFGHTGFTGTMAWADPEYGLVYIFLSNRVHPDQHNNKLVEMNIRTRVQEVAYRAMGLGDVETEGLRDKVME